MSLCESLAYFIFSGLFLSLVTWIIPLFAHPMLGQKLTRGCAETLQINRVYTLCRWMYRSPVECIQTSGHFQVFILFLISAKWSHISSFFTPATPTHTLCVVEPPGLTHTDSVRGEAWQQSSSWTLQNHPVSMKTLAIFMNKFFSVCTFLVQNAEIIVFDSFRIHLHSFSLRKGLSTFSSH